MKSICGGIAYFGGMRLYDEDGNKIHEDTSSHSGNCEEVTYELGPDEYLVGFHGQYSTSLHYIVKLGLITVKYKSAIQV